jgi:hypothetical protein
MLILPTCIKGLANNFVKQLVNPSSYDQINFFLFFIFYCQGSFKFADIRALQRAEMPRAGAKYVLGLVPWLCSVIGGHFCQFYFQIC